MTRKLLGSLALLSLTACGGDPSSVEVVDGSSQDVTETPTLVGTRWQWTGTISPTERIEVADPTRYTLLLQPDGSVEAMFDCNRGGGGYELADNRLTFGPMMATRMACPPDSQDAVYMRQLGQIASYFIDDGELYLEMPGDGGTMRFTPAATQ